MIIKEFTYTIDSKTVETLPSFRNDPPSRNKYAGEVLGVMEKAHKELFVFVNKPKLSPYYMDYRLGAAVGYAGIYLQFRQKMEFITLGPQELDEHRELIDQNESSMLSWKVRGWYGGKKVRFEYPGLRMMLWFQNALAKTSPDFYNFYWNKRMTLETQSQRNAFDRGFVDSTLPFLMKAQRLERLAGNRT